MRFLMMMMASILLILEIGEVTSDDVIMQKSFYNRDSEPSQEQTRRNKKPFCNAFTGCGRKRSDDSMASLFEMNEDPALEELNRQLASEAKLWEAIQEARLDNLSRKQKERDEEHSNERITSNRNQESHPGTTIAHEKNRALPHFLNNPTSD